DRALLDDLHRRREGTRAHEERNVIRLASAHAAADLHPTAADLLANDRRRDHLGLALFDQHDRHALADVVAGYFLEDARAGAVENILGARGILHSGKLHDHAIGPLLLDDGLGNAELIDAIAQDGDVLLHGAVLDPLLRLGFQIRNQPGLAAGIDFPQLQIRERLVELLKRTRALT